MEVFVSFGQRIHLETNDNMKKRKFKLLGMTPCRGASIWVAGPRQGQVTRLRAFSSLLVRLLLPPRYLKGKEDVVTRGIYYPAFRYIVGR